MERFIESSYTGYISYQFTLTGIVLVLLVLYKGLKKAREERKDSATTLMLVHGIRAGLLGISILCIGLELIRRFKSLIILSLFIGVQELFETTFVIAALKSSA